ncbi:MAG: WG repeat-containing protein [Terriglobia bacterium]|jgi:hypothetical protein
MRPLPVLAGFVAGILFPMLVSAQSIRPIAEGPLVVVKDGRYGYINHKGEIAIQPQFFWASDFENGFAPVYVCGREVWIDEVGRPVARRSGNSQKLEPRRLGEKIGFADPAGRFRIRPIFDDVLPFSDGMAAVRVDDLWGFIDSTGYEVIPPTFKDAFYFLEGVGTAETADGPVLIDRTGKTIASGFELTHGIVAEGRVPVCRNDKCGFLDLLGNIAIPLVYDDVDSFSRGLASVRKGEKWGYIDESGHTSIPFVYDQAGPFASGLAPVRTGKESGFIDRSGKLAFNLAFQYAPGFLTGNSDGLLVAESDVSRFWTDDGSFGYVDTSGKVIWGPTKESPDHAPVLGWSEQDKIASCKGLPQALQDAVIHFPQQ